MRYTMKGHQTARTTTIALSPCEWRSSVHTASEVESEEEDEIDELWEDSSNVAGDQSLGSNVVASKDMTQSRVQALHPNLTRHVQATTTTTSATTNNGPGGSASNLLRKDTKRRRCASISASCTSDHRPAKQHRSRAPSPPSLLGFQQGIPIPPSSSLHHTNLHALAIPFASVPGLPSTSVSSTGQHVPAEPQPTVTGTGMSRMPTSPQNPQSNFVLVNRELMDNTAALLTQLLALSQSSPAAAVENTVGPRVNNGVRGHNSVRAEAQRPHPAPVSANASSQAGRSTKFNVSAPSTDRAQSIASVDSDPEYNARRSRTIIRSLGASYRINGKSCVPTSATNASAGLSQASSVSSGASTVVPYTSPSETWTETVKSIYGSGSETRGVTKPKLQHKQRAQANTSNINTSSVPPHKEPPVGAASVKASSTRHAVQPMDIDNPRTPPARSQAQLQADAEKWAAIIRSFVKGKSTRVSNHNQVFQTLFDAGGARWSSRVLVQSGLYRAVLALGRLSVAREMFGAIDAARALTDRWTEEFGADALEEDD